MTEPRKQVGMISKCIRLCYSKETYHGCEFLRSSRVYVQLMISHCHYIDRRTLEYVVGVLAGRPTSIYQTIEYNKPMSQLLLYPRKLTVEPIAFQSITCVDQKQVCAIPGRTTP